MGTGDGLPSIISNNRDSAMVGPSSSTISHRRNEGRARLETARPQDCPWTWGRTSVTWARVLGRPVEKGNLGLRWIDPRFFCVLWAPCGLSYFTRRADVAFEVTSDWILIKLSLPFTPQSRTEAVGTGP